MNDCWLGFHTFDVEMRIDDLKNSMRKTRITPVNRLSRCLCQP